MTWEPTPEQVERCRLEENRAYLGEHPEAVVRILRAFVPEGTVPVFLTREDAEGRRDQLLSQGELLPLTEPQQRQLVALDAALKEAEGK